MSPIEPVWLFGAIVLVCGVFLGMLIQRLMNPSAGDVDQLKADLERERTEIERYKASVNSHFDKTSELVNDLTQDYVKVYRHLAEGAQTLSDTREFTQVLEQPQGRVLISVEDDAGVSPKPDSEAVPAEAVKAEAAAARDADADSAAVDTAGVADPGAVQPADTDVADETVATETASSAVTADDSGERGKEEAAGLDKARASSVGESQPETADGDKTDKPEKV